MSQRDRKTLIGTRESVKPTVAPICAFVLLGNVVRNSISEIIKWKIERRKAKKKRTRSGGPTSKASLT
jgi:hypothetical protein